jgi:hypothetical protein
MSSLEQAVRSIVDMLVEGKLEELETLSERLYFTAETLQEALDEFPYKPVPLPDEGWWEEVTVIPVTGRPEYNVAAPLWTKEEGRSDLTFEMSLTELPDGGYDVTLNQLHG